MGAGAIFAAIAWVGFGVAMFVVQILVVNLLYRIHLDISRIADGQGGKAAQQTDHVEAPAPNPIKWAAAVAGIAFALAAVGFMLYTFVSAF